MAIKYVEFSDKLFIICFDIKAFDPRENTFGTPILTQ